MPVYQRSGNVPDKRHTVYRQPNGDLYHEELFGTEGFGGVSSLIYHLNPPTMVSRMGEPYSVRPEIAVADSMKALSFLGFSVEPAEEWLESRKTLFVNGDLHIGLAAPRHSMESHFFKNADADEMLFIHQGSGQLKTPYGSIPFEYGDYLIIPRGTTYQLKFDSSDNRILYIESFSPIRTPRRYRNEYFRRHSGPNCRSKTDSARPGAFRNSGTDIDFGKCR